MLKLLSRLRVRSQKVQQRDVLTAGILHITGNFEHYLLGIFKHLKHNAWGYFSCIDIGFPIWKIIWSTITRIVVWQKSEGCGLLGGPGGVMSRNWGSEGVGHLWSICLGFVGFVDVLKAWNVWF